MIDWLTPQIVASVGFPIAVAVYSLTRLEKTIKDNTGAINNLALTLSKNKRR